MTFVRNNISYRSACAKALEGFFCAKAFQLNQIISTRNAFSETPKEVLLLMFNTHNRALFFVETLLLDKKTVTLEDVNAIIGELKSQFQEMSDIFDQNINVFDSNFIRHWMQIHKQLLYFLYSGVESVMHSNPMLAFSMITQTMIDYLNATLFELYELDCLLGSYLAKKRITTNDSNPNVLILYMDDASQRYAVGTGLCPEIERLLYYVNTLIGVTRFDVQIHNYMTRCDGEDGNNRLAIDLLLELKQMSYIDDVTISKKVSR
jgi:hypothetical protein